MLNIWPFKQDTSARKKVFVGLSGGVDSAVSAALLVQAGYEVTGVFIRISVEGYPCTAAEDRRDALRVATHLRIPFLELDLSKEYNEQVFKNTINEYKKGNTPNPDTLCNREIKFGKFYEFARSRGADFIATGHYARPVKKGFVSLFQGIDPDKDQSYFLWMVPEKILEHVLFPIGNKKKSEVRALATKFGLPNAERKDSQGLCFLGPVSIDEMLTQELKPRSGEVLDENGQIIGEHQGSVLYTLGQRHGFDLTAQSPKTPAHYVIAKDVERNTITVSPNKFPVGVTKTVITLREQNWVGPLYTGLCRAQYRYHQTFIPALVLHQGGSSVVELQEPHYAPLGQSLVLYDKERCLGGGIIGVIEYR